MAKSKSLMRWMAGIIAVFMAGSAIAADSGRIGVYSPAADGGRAVGEAAIRNTLVEADFTVEEFSRLSLENLLKYRVIIIPNTPVMARNEDPRWRDNLRAYVIECGGAIIFNHDAVGAERSVFGQVPLFPEIVVSGSVQRSEDAEARRTREFGHAVQVAVHPQPDEADADFNYLPGYEFGQEIRHMYYDHFMLDTADGTALLVDPTTSKAVVAVGEVGKGRLVFNGMLGAHPSGLAAHLEDINRDVMINTVRWCLAGPQLAVTDADTVEVAVWNPDTTGSSKSRNKVAVIGDVGIRNRAAATISRAGVEHDFIPLHFLHVRDLDSSGYKLVVFFGPYGWAEQDIPDDSFEKITDFIKAGGKAIVFLPMNIGRKTASNFMEPFGIDRAARPVRDNPDILRAFQWTDPSGHVLEVKDIPENWFTAITEPTVADAKTVGYWHDKQGAKKSPAIIRTPYGYLVNINTTGDHRMFTANAVAELVPELAPDVFNHLLATFNNTRQQMSKLDFSTSARSLQERSEALHQSAKAAATNKAFTDANRLILEAESELVKAYAVSMPVVIDEERIAFIWTRHLPDPEIICAELAETGFNAIAISGLEGRYPSPNYGVNLQPGGAICETKDGEPVIDWLKKWIDAAAKYGLKFGLAICPYSVYAGHEIYDRAVAEDWRVVPGGRYGTTPEPFRKPLRPRFDDICRSRPEMADYAIARTVEVLKNYPVDYIFFDYIRWQETCYCDYCMEKFQADTGLKIEQWPDDAMGKFQSEYNDWRARPITRVVRETATHIAEINPEIKTGAYTFRGKNESYDKGQYWWEWSDYVDYIMPMYYRADNQYLEDLFQHINDLLPTDGKARLMACVAPPGRFGGSNLDRLQQIYLQRKYAPAGMMYFCYHVFTGDYFELLRIGPWRDR